MIDETLYLCATTRLAQTLRGELPAEGQVWASRQALTIGQWLGQLADAALIGGEMLPQALDNDAERLLWEQVIADSLAAGAGDLAALFDPCGLAASAMEAHALCRVWGLQAGGNAEENRWFAQWQQSFLQRCSKAGWIDQAGLQAQLCEAISAGNFALPARIQFAGFDRLTPFEKRLGEALAARGCRVENACLSPVDRSENAVFSCADSSAECHAAVDWVLRELAAQPTARLGIVAPDLAAVRDRLACLLDDALHPGALRPDAAEMPRRFNFSLGQPLADQPLVTVALDLLALGNGRGKLEQQRLSALLLAGAWQGASSEMDGRASLDAALRRDLPYFTRCAALLALGERRAAQGSSDCPATLAALAAGTAVLAAAPGKLRPGQWGALFKRALTAFGWPGERALSSNEFQARRAFVEVLDGFGRLDGLLGPLTHGAALARLRDLCRQRLFQPETRGQPAVQVLGVLESAGLAFDALWVMGMNDDRWPAAARPNPLLSAETQRDAASSHASAEVELDFACRVHARLLRSAPFVNFSYARADGNRVLRPSPLLLDLPPAVDRKLRLETAADRLALEGGLVAVNDALAPPLQVGEKVAGGSWLLRAQALCPAWAFYQFRLGAQAMDAPVEGLDPAARGTLVHGALEAFWKTVGDSRSLQAQGELVRAKRIAAAVDVALADFEAETRSPLPPRFRQLEAARLCRLLARWLDFEAGRALPFTVIACEQPARVEIEGIRVHMVVDRIDRLEDGREVIIDYKTGASIETRNWASERITEPQLPIYAALVNKAVAAVAFAKVLPDKPAFSGVAEAGDMLPGVHGLGEARQKVFASADFPDWPAVIAHWDARMHAIAREVRDGVAGVSFADESGLKYCEVLPLLRLPERRRLLAEMRGGKA